jgi:isopentenyl diphosphate isomerase/L-lactate dehydrogenase-like FMN-dependent dehydrogenase
MIVEPIEDKPLEQLSLAEIYELFKRRVRPEPIMHVMGAAESESSMQRNRAALDRLLFRQKIFHTVTDPDPSIELFGHRLPTPAMIAPVGSFRTIRKNGEHEVAEGGSLFGTMVFISGATLSTVDEWAQGITSPLVYMAYLSKGREKVLNSVRRAEEIGYTAVGLTMDTLQPTKLKDQVPMSSDGKPRTVHHSSPKDIEWLKKEVSIPVVVKGIINPDDARIAVEAGADCLVVSNHGGRIVDFSRAAIEALPEVVDAVEGRVPVLLDSGARRGSDVVKALALGAKGVLLGRPICWGLGVAGPQGVDRVLQIFRDEMKRVMILTGTQTVADIGPSLLSLDEKNYWFRGL